MRPPIVLGAVWLVATVIATWVGFTATHTVGDVIRGTGPVGAAFDPAPEPTPVEHAPRISATFSYPAGRLVAECAGPVATLIEASASRGWTIVEKERGPDEDVDVEFTSNGKRTEIEVYCNDGEPRPVVSESSFSG